MIARDDGKSDRVLTLLPQLESRLREARVTLASLRREGATAAGSERFRVISAALDEIEETLDLVRETRQTLTQLEQRLMRRFDQLLQRLRENEPVDQPSPAHPR